MKQYAGIDVSLEYSSVRGGRGWLHCAGSKDPQLRSLGRKRNDLSVSGARGT